jgi:hypothetical protein
MMLPPLDQETIDSICAIADSSDIADYEWDDRGEAPVAYTQGMAIAFAHVLRKYVAHDTSAREMAKANTHDAAHDALSFYNGIFEAEGMSNDVAGIDTLRHVFVFLLGLGMRESSGRHCEGRDQSATNVESDTAEAGLFQMSWNARSCSPEMNKLMDEYAIDMPQCYLEVFREDVDCSQSDWSCYGSGDGYDYQAKAKACPQFAVETAAVGIRNNRQHWGPIGRYEVEVLREADNMFMTVQKFMQIVDVEEPPPPIPAQPTVSVDITTSEGVELVVRVDGVEVS